MTKVLTSIDETIIDSELERVINFRLQWLLHAGYSNKNAILLAEATTNVDWHFACELLKKCDDQKLAMKILL